MKLRNKILVTFLIMVFCLPMLSTLNNVYAAKYNLPYSVNKSDLTDHRGDEVTGKDIVDTCIYLASRSGATYSNIGTCTGFVTRVGRYLKLAGIGTNGAWDKFYDESNWDVPGDCNYNGSPAPYMPSGFETAANNNGGTYIGRIIVDQSSGVGKITGFRYPDGTTVSGGQSLIDTVGIKDGDLFVTKETATRNGHVAFAIIVNGHVRSIGAAGEKPWIGDCGNTQSNKDGDIEVWRIAKQEEKGSLVIIKTDNHEKPLKGVKFKIEGPDGFTTVEKETNAQGKIELNDIPLGKYTITELETLKNIINVNVSGNQKHTITLNESKKDQELPIENQYQRGAVRLKKFDKDLPEDSTLLVRGDATLEGAEFRIYANEEIKEGETTIYAKDELVKVRYDSNEKKFIADKNGNDKIRTDDKGDTKTITNLPIGKYYFKEIKPSEGMKLNGDNLTFEIKYDSTANEPVEIICSCPEGEVWGNVEIAKYLEATDYDPEIVLAGAQFTLTLKSDNTQTYKTNISGYDGICRINKIPFGVYTASETKVPVGAVKAEDFDVIIDRDKADPYYYRVNDKSTSMRIEIYKELVENARGITDAKVQGAYFTVYTDPACTQKFIDKNNNEVVIGPTNERGYAISGKMRTKTYYLKETVFPEGINPDAKIPGENVTYRDKVYVAKGDPDTQEEQLVTLTFTVENMIDLGSIRVMKYDDDPDSTEESAAKGAILRLTLDSSNGSVYYDAVINEYGRAVPIDSNGNKIVPEADNADVWTSFVCERFMENYPHTIPYGHYTISEIKASDGNEHTRFYMNKEKVSITAPNQDINSIIIQQPLTQLYLKVIKTDAETKRIVPIAGASFKIWDCQENKFVELMETPSGDMIDTFSTNPEGYFFTGYVLKPGDYIVYEVQAPKKGFNGYYLEDIYRLPENKADYGKKNGKRVTLNKNTAGIKFDANLNDPNVKKYLEVEMSDRPVKGKIEVEKKGLMLTDVDQKITEEYGTIKSPKYELRGLKDVTYKIYAAEEITSVDGTEQKIPKDGLCGTIVTGENGIGTSEELPLGKYYLKETDAPEGTIINPEPVYVELKYKNQYERVVTEHVSLTNEKQKVELQIPKAFGGTKYEVNEEQEKYAIFGIFANQRINNYNGRAIIGKDDLLEVIRVDEKNPIAISTADLPQGKYYYQEIFASDPYLVDRTKHEFEVVFDKSNNPKLVIKEKEIVNKPDTAELYLIKLSASSFYKGQTLVGLKGLDEKVLEEESRKLADQLKGMSKEEVEKYLADKENGKISLAGAKYAIYLDKECTKPLKEKKENGEKVDVVVTTNEYGMAELEDIPLGIYYLKEIEAPKNYKVTNDVVMIELTQNDKSVPSYRVVCDNDSRTVEIDKIDIFTGDEVPNCTFEIRDSEGNVLIHNVTDEKGKMGLDKDFMDSVLEKGEKYYFVELDAPEKYKEENGKLYELNTEPHEFVYDYEIDENEQIIFHNKHAIENYRPTRNVLVRKVDEETGEPLKGCKFSIVLLQDENDENPGELYVNNKGENVYAVKDAVTDENGECLVENVPVGRYKFIEVEAPEGYDLAEQNMDGYEFEVRNDSPDTIVFEVTNTGDIAVYAIAGVFAVSLIGIVYLALRKRNARA